MKPQFARPQHQEPRETRRAAGAVRRWELHYDRFVPGIKDRLSYGRLVVVLHALPH